MIKDYTVEHSIVGGLLIDNSQWESVKDILVPGDFKDRDCHLVYKAIYELDGKISQTLIDRHLRDKYKEIKTSFLADLLVLSDGVGLVECANKVKDNSIREQIRKIGDNLNKHRNDEHLDTVIENAHKELVSLVKNVGETFIEPAKLAIDLLNYMAEMRDRGGTISGISTGFKSLDNITDGLKTGLIIIGARPSIGKTSLMVSMALHISISQKKQVAIFSLESDWKELGLKALSILTGISSRRLSMGNIWGEDEKTVAYYSNMIAESGFRVNSLSGLNILEIRSHLKRMIQIDKRPSAVFIDYLGLITPEEGYAAYHIKIGNITKALKQIAKELNVPVVLLVQVNRANLEMAPRLLDLKDSGSIEADADLVILLHREEFYKKAGCAEDKKGKIEIDIAKNRNGPVERMMLNWIGESTTIKE